MLELQGTRLFVGPLRHVALLVELHPGSEGIHSFALDGGAALFVDQLLNKHIHVRTSDAMHLTGYGTSVYDMKFRDRFIVELMSPIISTLRNINDCQFYRVYIERAMCLGSPIWRKLPDYAITIEDIPLGEFDQFHGAWPISRRRFEGRFQDSFFPGTASYLSGLWDAIDRGDIAGVAGLLHDWERRRVEDAGIAHLWAPSPFPFEELDSEKWYDIDPETLLAPFREIDAKVRAVRHWRAKMD